jgi:hypothetical protein
MSLEQLLLLRAKLLANEADHALKDAEAYTTFAQFKEAEDKMAESQALMRQVSHLTQCVQELVHND